MATFIYAVYVLATQTHTLAENFYDVELPSHYALQGEGYRDYRAACYEANRHNGGEYGSAAFPAYNERGEFKDTLTLSEGTELLENTLEYEKRVRDENGE